MTLALRNLRAAPLYTVAAIGTLALAIAANSAILAVVHAVLLRPLPIENPEELVVVWESDAARNVPVVELTYNQILEWQSETRHFSSIAALGSSTWSVVVEGHGVAVRLASSGVSSSFFSTLGARPVLGRSFSAADDELENGHVALLSHGQWQERFGGDPAVLGRTLHIDRQPHTIIGVMPRDFDFPRGTDVWLPLVPILRQSAAVWKTDVLEHVRVLYLLGRLRPDVTIDMARQDLDAVAARRPIPSGARRATHVVALLDHLLGPARIGLSWVMAAVAVLLLVACANVSALTLTRSSLRRRDHAVRLALGSSRAGLARTWIAETLVLAGLAGAIGLLGARWILALVVRLAPDDLPRVGDAAIGAPIAAFTVGLVVATAALCAAPAACFSARIPPGELLRDARSTEGRRSTRSRAILVVTQVALAVVLLVCAGLVVRSFANLRALDLGFDPGNVLTMQIEPGTAKPPAREWFTELIDRVRHLPGVEGAGAVSLPPLAYDAIGHDADVVIEGQPDPGDSSAAALEARALNPTLNFQMATPDYFRVMRIPLLRGRLFDSRDHSGTPAVVVIGEHTARRLWPGQDPIGKRLRPQGSSTPGSSWQTVIGVVKDVRYRGLDDVRLDLYEPAAQSARTPGFLVIRTAGKPIDLAAAVQREARAFDPAVVVGTITTLDAVVERRLAPWRLSSWMLTLFASITVVLAIVGLLGQLGLEVTQRVREYAVRLAIGAEPRHLRTQVLRSAALRAAAGLAAGLVAALAISRWLRTLLFGVTSVDPTTYASVAATVGVLILMASLIPAVHAARTNPTELLRRE